VPEAIEREKIAAAREAAARVQRRTRVALGTGSTAAYAIRRIVERFPDGGGLTTVASSAATEKLARELGLSVRPLEEGDRFDLMIDGADEVTPRLELTKGGGGALFREKLLARHSREVLIAVDHTKLVRSLGERAPIPIEVVPFARPALLRELKDRGFLPTPRVDANGHPFLSDNGNEIIDLRLGDAGRDPAEIDHALHGLTGVVETGIFIGLAHRVFVGEVDGTVRELHAGATG
jgi:ribose 5-phosphate isomerase A